MERKEEFIGLVERYKAVIYKVCYMYAPQGEIDDYYQEVLVRLWNAWPQFRGESSTATWVYRVSLYTCISFVRRRYARPATIPLAVDLQIPEDNAEEQRCYEELRAVIDNLGRLDRALILLWLEERTYTEIAEITGLSHANVGVKLMRIREKIKHMFNR